MEMFRIFMVFCLLCFHIGPPSPTQFPVSFQKTQLILRCQTIHFGQVAFLGMGVLLPISSDFNSMRHGTANSHSSCPQEETKTSWSLKQLLREAFSATCRPSLNLFPSYLIEGYPDGISMCLLGQFFIQKMYT